MRIMQIFPKFLFGGAEIMCANLSIALHNLGQDVIVISLYNYKSPITKKMEDAGVKVVFLNKKGGVDFNLLRDLYQVVKAYRPDVIHSHLYICKYAHFISMLAGIQRRVHTIHSLANRSDRGINRIVNRILFSFFNVIPVALSITVKNSVLSTYGIDEKKVPVVFNGIPLDKCLSINSYKYKIDKYVHIGRFTEPKNHINLIKGFARFHEYNKEAKLFLYGEGELLKECKKLVTELNANEYIVFCGLTSDVYKVLNEMDVFILPSLWEGMPMTLIEAMGTGLPIIASNVGGIPDMLEDGVNAILINPDSDSIACALKRICNDYELRKRIGINALKHSLYFSAEKMAKEYTKVYESE